jgi:hypothetical protein
MQHLYIDHKKHQREAPKKKNTNHEVNVAKVKKQKNKKKQRTSTNPKTNLTQKKFYHTKNVYNASQKPQQERKKKTDDHQKKKIQT